MLSTLPFAGIGGYKPKFPNPYASSGKTPPDLGERLMQYGRKFGLSTTSCQEAIASLLVATKEFAPQVRALLDAIPIYDRRHDLRRLAAPPG